MNGVLNIDTDACEQYAKQLDEVQYCYLKVTGWSSFVGGRIINVLANLEKKMKSGEVLAILTTIPDTIRELKNTKESIGLILDDMGDRCIIRLKNHFRETSSQMTRVEKALCNRGEKLFDL